jgi:tRNA(Ile)-lysidine synthase
MSLRCFSVAERRVVRAVEATVDRVLAQVRTERGQRLLVALSGGPDSVALFHALHRIRERWGFELLAAHLNHNLRGSESERDEQFVRALCQRLRVELIVERAQGLTSPNLEERARLIRYDFLNRAAHSFNARFIVLGHHQNDQAETFLLRLLRGTGVGGLAAMKEWGPGCLVRPLLSIDRDTILAYVKAIGASYVIDSSNSDKRSLRNRVRSGLLPQLARDYSPNILSHLAELASEMREVHQFLHIEAERALDRLRAGSSLDNQSSDRISVSELGSMSPALARAVMRELIAHRVGHLRGIRRSHIEAMTRVATGSKASGIVVLPRGWRFRRENDTAVLEHADYCATRKPSTDQPVMTLKQGNNVLGPYGYNLTLSEISIREPNFPSAPWHPASRFEAYFDGDLVAALSVRGWRAGDRIRPLGLNGRRKIHDVFIDKKIPVASRKRWPLVTCDDEVLWIPGIMRSRLALVTGSSRKVLHLRADPLPGDSNVRLPEV